MDLITSNVMNWYVSNGTTLGQTYDMDNSNYWSIVSVSSPNDEKMEWINSIISKVKDANPNLNVELVKFVDRQARMHLFNKLQINVDHVNSIECDHYAVKSCPAAIRISRGSDLPFKPVNTVRIIKDNFNSSVHIYTGSRRLSKFKNNHIDSYYSLKIDGNEIIILSTQDIMLDLIDASITHHDSDPTSLKINYFTNNEGPRTCNQPFNIVLSHCYMSDMRMTNGKYDKLTRYGKRSSNKFGWTIDCLYDLKTMFNFSDRLINQYITSCKNTTRAFLPYGIHFECKDRDKGFKKIYSLFSDYREEIATNPILMCLMCSFINQSEDVIDGIRVSDIINHMFKPSDSSLVLYNKLRDFWVNNCSAFYESRNINAFSNMIIKSGLINEIKSKMQSSKNIITFNKIMKMIPSNKNGKTKYPLFKKYFEDEILKTSIFKQPSNSLMINLNFELWEKFLNKHGSRAESFVNDLLVNGDFTHKHLMSYFDFILNKFPKYLHKHTGYNWSIIPSVSTSQISKPTVNNHTKQITFPYLYSTDVCKNTYSGLNYDVLTKNIWYMDDRYTGPDLIQVGNYNIGMIFNTIISSKNSVSRINHEGIEPYRIIIDSNKHVFMESFDYRKIRINKSSLLPINEWLNICADMPLLKDGGIFLDGCIAMPFNMERFRKIVSTLDRSYTTDTFRGSYLSEKVKYTVYKTSDDSYLGEVTVSNNITIDTITHKRIHLPYGQYSMYAIDENIPFTVN